MQMLVFYRWFHSVVTRRGPFALCLAAISALLVKYCLTLVLLIFTINLVLQPAMQGAPASKKLATQTFSLEVPEGWTVTNTAEEWRMDGPDNKDSANMSVRWRVVKGTLSDYVHSYRKEMTSSPNMSEILGEKSATVAGLPARCVDALGPCVSLPNGFYRCRSRCWLLLSNGRGYEILAAANGDLTRYEAIFERVLKSFSPQP